MQDFWHFEFENWPNGIFDKRDSLNQMALLQATLTQQWALKRKAQVGKGRWIQMFPEKKLFAQKLALCKESLTKQDYRRESSDYVTRCF